MVSLIARKRVLGVKAAEACSKNPGWPLFYRSVAAAIAEDEDRRELVQESSVVSGQAAGLRVDSLRNEGLQGGLA